MNTQVPSQRRLRKSTTKADTGAVANHSLLHHLQVDFLHVDLLVELGRELGALEELRVYAASHGCGEVAVCSGRRRK